MITLTRQFLALGVAILPALLAAAALSPHHAVMLPNPLQSPLVAASLSPPAPVDLKHVQVRTVAQLEQLFDSLNYTWPPAPGRSVPRIAIDPLPADLAQVTDSKRRKGLFFRALLPMVLAENERLHAERDYALKLFQAENVPLAGSPARRWLDARLARYNIVGDINQPAIQRKLLQRLDVVPSSLALAQAASESGWGVSRLAREDNNFFGHMTANRRESTLPDAPPMAIGASFGSLRDSVRVYVNNLNTSAAYREMWQLREQMHRSAEWLDPLKLSAGLVRYSERGMDYVEDIRTIIRNNGLQGLRHVNLEACHPAADVPLPG